MEKKISVIIPVYGTEKYLRKCLSSVINQTYGNIEVIIVNDCSPDNSQRIINEYVEKYEHIQCVELEKNGGLFHARLAGFDVATGDYVAFLDSDDYLAVDAYRAMVHQAESTQSDIVFGKIVIEWEADGRQETHAYNEPLFNRLEGSAIVERYLEQEGYTFFWYAVWNKIFSKEIFDQARPYFDRITEHTIMAEDVAFCSVLLAMADRISCIDYYTNYYLQSATSSTSRGADQGKYVKNIKDMCRVMDFVEAFVMEYPRYEGCKDKFHRFKEVFVLYWRTSISGAMFSRRKKKECLKALKKYAKMSEIPDHDREGERSLTYDTDRSFIYNQLASFHSGYEEIIQQVSDQRKQIILFPFDDILFKKNIMDEDDLFGVLERAYQAVCPKGAAADCMALRKSLVSGDGNMTIDGIYESMRSSGVERHVCEELKNREIKLLKQVYARRESAKQLFDLAVYLGKRVIVQVDNHFSENMAKAMLKAHGYEGYQEIRFDQDASTEEIHLHFYSTEKANKHKKAEQAGRIAYPRAVSVLLHRCGMFDYFRKSQGCQADFFGNLLNKSSVAVAANLYFDNPFRPFDSKTDFNRDAYLMGLLPIAMFTMNLARWLMGHQEYDEIYFDKASRSLMERVNRYFEWMDKKVALKGIDLSDQDGLAFLEEGKKGAAYFGLKRNLVSPAPAMDRLWVYGDAKEKANRSEALYLFLDSSLPKVAAYLLGAFDDESQAFYSEKLINFHMRKGVADFTDQMLSMYSEDLLDMRHDCQSMTYPFDYLLHTPKFKDIGVFDYCSLYFEKENEVEEMSLFNYWLQVNVSKADMISGKVEVGGSGIGYYPFLQNKSTARKALFFLFFDQDTLFEKLKIRFGANIGVYKIIEFIESFRGKKEGQDGECRNEM